MSTPTAPALVLEPKIPTGNRSVIPKGKPPTPFIFGVSLLPAMGFGIALSDDRLGFKLFMVGIAVAMMVLVVALYLWTQALTAGVIRIAASGPLRFVPPTYLRKALFAIALGFLVPGAISITVSLLGMPNLPGGSIFTTVMSYVLTIVTLVLLAQLAWSARVAEGLTVGPDGLSGVRGASRIAITWDDLVSASTPGKHGPKLTLNTHSQGEIVIDAHHLGSDPAIVAKVLDFYRTHPHERARLGSGADAIGAVVDASSAR